MRRCGVALTVLLSGLAASFPLPLIGDVMPPDLGLRETTAQKIVVSPRSNPHELMECSDCHPVKPTRSPETATKSESLLKEEYPDSLCLRCHKGLCGHHPPDITLTKSQGRDEIPKVFPLRFVDEERSRIVCMTCHDIHYPHTGYKLLRGYAVNPSVQPSVFRTRLDFCRGCHGRGLDLLTPHKTGKNQKGCLFCHSARPEAAKPQPLRDNVNSLCSSCHPVYPEPHYFHFNPFPDLPPQAADETGAGVSHGTTTCATCHQPHGSTSEPAYLRPEFIKIALGSVRVNPHRGRGFCGTCHLEGVRPDSKGPPPLREADMDTLCNRCHDSGKITGMYHPLQTSQGGLRPAANFPITAQGNLMCTTCHQPGCGAPTRGNVNFLRGGPYQNLNLFCRICHPDRQPSNPHPETAGGKGCERCHLAGTAYQANGVQVGLTKADDNFLCLICHPGFPHPADFKHTVRPGKYDYVVIKTEYPLDRFGRITCYTCHQIHQAPAAADFLRRPAAGQGPLICSGCHPY